MKQTRITHIQHLLLTFFIAMTVGVGAWGESSMEKAFAEMPDSIIPYMTRNNRLDCIDFIKNNMKAEVENKFGNKSVLTTMTDNYLRLHLNEITDVEMKIFKVDGKDSILCMAKTIKTPEADTEIKFFNLNWEEMDCISVPQDCNTADMKREPTMCEASLSKDDETITIKLRRFFTNDKELKNDAATAITYIWNGKTLEQKLH